MTTFNSYTMKDLKTVPGKLNRARTTKLIDRRTGAKLIEVIGYATKSDCHIAYLREQTKLENLDCSVGGNNPVNGEH